MQRDDLSSAAVTWGSDARARVGVVGADARGFLHRMSTNKVSDLAAGEGRLNALVTDKGRFVDLVHHLDRGEAGVLLVGGRGRGAALVAWLDRFIFTERIDLLDRSGLGSCAEIAGARAPAIVDTVVEGAAALPPWAFVECDGRVVVRAFDRVDGAGARVPSFIVVDLERPRVTGALAIAGATEVDAADAEALRIAAGVPGETGELVEAFNPLELALHDAIHWAKGCYIGQEVIARLDTYAKVGRRLVGLVLNEAARARVVPGAPVVVDGKPAGAVTSVSPRHNGTLPSALAMVGVASPDATAHIQVGGGVVEVRVVERAVAQAPHD